MIHAVCHPRGVSEVHDLPDTELDRANYPIRRVEVRSYGDEQVELVAVLVPSTADEAELDGVVAALDRSPLVLSSTWSVEATS